MPYTHKIFKYQKDLTLVYRENHYQKKKGFNRSLDTGESLTRVRSEVGEGQERSFLLQKKKKRTQERERERRSQ